MIDAPTDGLLRLMLTDAIEELGGNPTIERLLAHYEPGAIFGPRPATPRDADSALKAWHARRRGRP